MAGINRKHLAAYADPCPYWLLSVTLIRKYPTWLSNHLANRKIIFDPGTFTPDAVSYKYYLSFIDRYARSQDGFLQYDEIGDHEATDWYLRDMHRRGYKPIPILQPNGNAELLNADRCAIGGLLGMTPIKRKAYLDSLLKNNHVKAKIHLLGLIGAKWFESYDCAFSGDSTTWIPRAPWNKKRSIDEWIALYGEQNINLINGGVNNDF